MKIGVKTKRHRRIPTDDTALSGPMLKKAVDAILSHLHLDRSYDIPYLAGYSRDGRTIYIDRELPRTYAVGRKRVSVDRFLILHESVEKTLLDQLGLHYQHAHQIALRAERAAVEAEGLSWSAYDRFMQRYIKEAEDERVQHLPPDLDVKPYRDEHDAALLERMRRWSITDRRRHRPAKPASKRHAR